MRIYIYGAGDYGTRLVERIISENCIELVEAIIDSYTDKKELNGIQIIRPNNVQNYSNSVVIAIADRIEAQKIALQLKRNGFEKIYFVDEDFFIAKLYVFDDDNNLSGALISMDDTKPILAYLEYQVADNCNLNCKACAHFSNLVTKEVYASLEKYEHDLIRLSELFEEISIIRLMGGEPLLNKELPMFVKITRKHFPYSDIRIVTNGILIPSINSNDWKKYRRYAVTFDVSQYPPVANKLVSYVNILRNNRVKFYVGRPIDSFFVNLCRGGNADYIESYNEKCLSKICHFLRDGRIFACPRIPMAYEKMEELEFNFTENEYDDSSISIYNANSGWQVLELIYKPVPMCRICTDVKYVKWEQSGNEVDINAFFND